MLYIGEKVKKEITRLRKAYYSDTLINELDDYVRFFKKPEIGTIEPTATAESILEITSLLLAMLEVRERVLEVYLGSKKARNRLKIIEQRFIAKKQKDYMALKNNEQRSSFLFAGLPTLSKGLLTTNMLNDKCDLILKHIDNHTRLLKDTSYVLKTLLPQRGE